MESTLSASPTLIAIGSAELLVHGRGPTAVERFVLDVVVDEEGVVEEFQRDRRRQRVIEGAAEGLACREAQRGAQTFPGAQRIIGQPARERAMKPLATNRRLHRRHDGIPVIAQMPHEDLLPRLASRFHPALTPKLIVV